MKVKVKDYYKILGVPRTASTLEIKTVYRQLARKYHPDLSQRTKQDLEHFYEIQEAYRILGNLDNRLQYSILLNQDLIERELLNKKIDIPGFSIKSVKKDNSPQ
jgi:DnaJ-class molecular chaperone